MPGLVQADRLEQRRLAAALLGALFLPSVASVPADNRTVASTRGHEGQRRGAAEHQVRALSAGRQLVLEQVAAQGAEDRNGALAGV